MMKRLIKKIIWLLSGRKCKWCEHTVMKRGRTSITMIRNLLPPEHWCDKQKKLIADINLNPSFCPISPKKMKMVQTDSQKRKFDAIADKKYWANFDRDGTL